MFPRVLDHRHLPSRATILWELPPSQKLPFNMQIQRGSPRATCSTSAYIKDNNCNLAINQWIHRAGHNWSWTKNSIATAIQSNCLCSSTDDVSQNFSHTERHSHRQTIWADSSFHGRLIMSLELFRIQFNSIGSISADPSWPESLN